MTRWVGLPAELSGRACDRSVVRPEPVVQAQGDFSLPAVLCQDPPVADLDEPTIPRAVRPGAGGAAGHQ
jgi:hypothetical protein